MATVAQRAALDTRRKLRFERRLKPKLDRIFTGIARDVAAAVASGGPAAAGTVALQAAAIEAELLTHYTEVGRIFSRGLTNRLPNPIGVTGIERAAIEAELSQVFAQRAASQAQLIARTTANNIQRSVVAQIASAGGATIDNAELGRSVGTQLSRHFGKRTEGIACVETQHSAEVSKEVEVQVITPNTAQPTKEWVTQGDSKVRRSHSNADGQTVPLNMPFTVQGESLQHPGDPAGSASNIINCRCSSVVDTDAIISQRGGVSSAAA